MKWIVALSIFQGDAILPHAAPERVKKVVKSESFGQLPFILDQVGKKDVDASKTPVLEKNFLLFVGFTNIK